MDLMYQISIKAVISNDRGLLLRSNERAEWELLGGRLEPGETPEECVVREVAEESGISATVEQCLEPWLYNIGDRRTVLIVPYLCAADHVPARLHDQDGGKLRWFARDDVQDLAMPQGYKDSIFLTAPHNSRSEVNFAGAIVATLGGVKPPGWRTFPEYRPLVSAIITCQGKYLVTSPSPVGQGRRFLQTSMEFSQNTRDCLGRLVATVDKDAIVRLSMLPILLEKDSVHVRYVLEVDEPDTFPNAHWISKDSLAAEEVAFVKQRSDAYKLLLSPATLKTKALPT